MTLGIGHPAETPSGPQPQINTTYKTGGGGARGRSRWMIASTLNCNLLVWCRVEARLGTVGLFNSWITDTKFPALPTKVNAGYEMCLVRIKGQYVKWDYLAHKLLPQYWIVPCWKQAKRARLSRSFYYTLIRVGGGPCAIQFGRQLGIEREESSTFTTEECYTMLGCRWPDPPNFLGWPSWSFAELTWPNRD